MEKTLVIPYLPLERMIRERRRSLYDAFDRVLASARFIGGSAVHQFETEYARSTGTEFCVGVGNGLDALRLTLQALGIGSGDEVIVPAHTFAATILAVTACNATPIAVDVKREDATIDPSHLAAVMNPRVRAIVPVHIHGWPADMEAIWQFAKANRLFVVEDAAQAHGLFTDSQSHASRSDAICYSFYPSKNLGALGDAGCVVTNRSDLASGVRQLANYGSKKNKYAHECEGVNSRLDSLQAAFLTASLPELEEWNQRRREIARTYIESITSKSITLLHGLNDLQSGVWHHFVVLASRRDELRTYLASHGVETEIHYPHPAYALPAFDSYAELGPTYLGKHPIADQIAATTLSLPLHPWLHASEVEDIVSTLNEF